MRVLITGATGFIGSALCDELLRKKYQVNYLTMSTDELTETSNICSFLWNPSKNEIDLNCLKELMSL